MDAKQIRYRSVEAAKDLGVDVLATLPLFDEEISMRSADEIASRVLAMHAVAAAAYGFDTRKAISWLSNEALTDFLTGRERSFLFQGIGQPNQFQTQVEGMWALAWALGMVSELTFAKECDTGFVTLLPNLKQSQTTAVFCSKMRPRPTETIVSACDLAYCLHWAIRQSELERKKPAGKVPPFVVVERRRALEWILSDKGWDEISLDT